MNTVVWAVSRPWRLILILTAAGAVITGLVAWALSDLDDFVIGTEGKPVVRNNQWQ